MGRAGQDPSVKRATVLTIHLPSVSPPRPHAAAVSDWFSYIHYKPQVCNVGLAGAGAAVVEMWKYKIPPFKVWLGGGGEEILGSKCGHYLRPRVKLGQTVAFIDSTF